jgi:hypothetical protein
MCIEHTGRGPITISQMGDSEPELGISAASEDVVYEKGHNKHMVSGRLIFWGSGKVSGTASYFMVGHLLSWSFCILWSVQHWTMNMGCQYLYNASVRGEGAVSIG